MAEIDQAFDELPARIDRLDEAASLPKPDRPNWRIESQLFYFWTGVAKPARKIGRWAVETREIPRGRAKALELAVRAFNVRRPRDVVAWWKKNRKHLAVLLETKSWPERTGSSEDLHDIGPFAVHDTLHLTGAERDRTLHVVADAAKAIQDADPTLSRVLYGDVLVVGRLGKPSLLAWYYPAEDVVYLRPQPDDSQREVFNLIHELAHRYWHRFMGMADRKPWFSRHATLLRTPVDVPRPQVGDLLEMRGGQTEEIKDIQFLRGSQGPQAIVEGGRVPVASIVRVREQIERAKFFPTTYAMRDPEEHFADAFAMHVLGTLPEAHEQFFQEWLGSRGRTQNAMKRRLMRA